MHIKRSKTPKLNALYLTLLGMSIVGLSVAIHMRQTSLASKVGGITVAVESLATPKAQEGAPRQASPTNDDDAAKTGAQPTEPTASQTSVVQFGNDAAQQEFLARNNLTASDLRPVPLTKAFEVARPAKDLKVSDGMVVQQNQQYKALLTPNDPRHPQWFAARTGLGAAWDQTTGSSAVRLAVIDTGFALEHQEFTNRWHINSGEYGAGKENNGFDDDGNGLVDDWRGWDFAHDDNSPAAGSTNPYGESVSHGTAVAGVAVATGNNNMGLAGIDWAAKVLPLQVLSDNGIGYTTDIISALAYARAQGASVINLSLGTNYADPLLQVAINELAASGVVVVAAAGNDDCECITYPARYGSVVAVGASDEDDNRAFFSNYGRSLDLLAPGLGATNTTLWTPANPTSAYSGYATGTSLAAPLVSGVAGLFKAVNPSATAYEIVTAIQRSATKVGGMNGHNFTKQHGFGRLNAYLALRMATLRHPDGTLIINK